MSNKYFEMVKDISGGNIFKVIGSSALPVIIAVLLLLFGAGLSDGLAAPSLTIQDQIPSTTGSTVAVPVSFAAGGSSISVLAFSIDFDQTLLSFDPTDTDEDGVPDSITFNVPAAFGLKTVTYDAGDTDGELDFIISDITPPLSVLTDRVVVTITFQTLNPPETTEANVNFSSNPAASFGTPSGGSVAGTTDNGSVLIQYVNYYCDNDSDLYFGITPTGACSGAGCPPAGCQLAQGTDCNDADNKEHPNQTWYKDSDGDGYSDGTTNTVSCTRPAGYKVAPELTATSGDCNDGDAAIKPGATEVCDGIDNDCDSQIDEGVKNTYYRDSDGDTYGDAGNTTQACTQPAGYVSNSTDCNDGDAAIKPGATEVCDGIDNDCDGSIDEGVKNTYYRDADGDTYGDAGNTTQACTQPAGYVSNSTDCDDADNKEHPNQTWYKDSDGDGYSDGTTNTTSCTRPTGYKVASELTATSGDCNDGDAAIKPGATEVCDGIDNDCDSQIDEGVKNTYYRDSDGDAYGDAGNTTQTCTQPAGYVSNSTDCDDADNKEHPNQTWYKDSDGDGYSDGTTNTTSCTRPTGYKVASELTATSGDCNDGNAAIKPGANEACDNVDNDCNSGTADGSGESWYGNQTSCGLGVCMNTGQFTCANGAKTNTCAPKNPTGDDSNCNGADENCDGVADNNFVSTVTNCGTGVCAETGQIVCINGTTSNTCTPGIPGEAYEQSCSDSLDNDCDSYTDCDDADCKSQCIQPGDCNGDDKIDAGDITALVLEIFDGDGSSANNAPGGTFPGDPTGSDANGDGVIDAGDITCIVLIIFNGPGACGN